MAEALPTETAVPTPEIDATVQVLVAETLPTETAVPGAGHRSDGPSDHGRGTADRNRRSHTYTYTPTGTHAYTPTGTHAYTPTGTHADTDAHAAVGYCGDRSAVWRGP